MGRYVLQVFRDGKNSYRWVVFQISDECFMQAAEASQRHHPTQGSALAEGTVVLQRLDGLQADGIPDTPAQRVPL